MRCPSFFCVHVKSRLGLLLVLLLGGCGGRVQERPNVLLISLDTLRADHLSGYGYGRKTSPFLDELADRGTRFSHAFVNTHGTAQSHATLLSSQYQETHRVMHDSEREVAWTNLPQGLRMLQEILGQNGYLNLAVTEGGYMAGKVGFSRGFDEYVDDVKGIEEGTNRLTELLKARLEPDRPTFVFYHTYQVHAPYAPPDEYRNLFGEYPSEMKARNADIMPFKDRAAELCQADREFLVGMYDAEIRYTDDTLRSLFSELKDLGFLENALVIITSDHGEEFGEHGKLIHPRSLYEELLHVPLIIVGPQVKPRAVDNRLASSIDVMPTILNYVGLKVEIPMAGTDLLAASEDSEAQQAVISQFGNSLYSVRSHEWKLIQDLKRQSVSLYHLPTDPDEKRDRADEFDSVRLRLEERLEEWKLEVPILKTSDAETSPSERELSRLRSLGYLQGEATTARSDSEPPRRIVGHIDGVQDSSKAAVRSGETVTVSGWAADTARGAPVEKVILWVAGVRRIGEIRQFRPRPDVAAAHSRQDFLQSGWLGEFSIGDLKPGRYELRAKAVADDGTEGWLWPRYFRVVATGAAPQPGTPSAVGCLSLR